MCTYEKILHQAIQGSIHESVRWLDHVGMDIIEKGDAAAFRAYLKQYGNTICGRRPISVFLNVRTHAACVRVHAPWLQMMQRCNVKLTTRFTSYGQSSKASKRSDHSVSYAAAVVTQADS